MSTITITISATYDGYPISLSFEGQVERIPQLTKRLAEIGAPPPMSAPRAAQTNGSSDGDGPPADAPADVRDAWTKKVPFGKRKGELLGAQTDKELTYLAQECRMDDIKAAAKKLLAHRLGL